MFTSDKLCDIMPNFEILGASEILQSPPQDAGYKKVHLKCFYVSAYSIRKKKEELEALSQSQCYNIISIRKTW